MYKTNNEKYFYHHYTVTEFVRKEFLSREDKLLSLADELKGELTNLAIKEVEDYVGEFDRIINIGAPHH